MAEEQYVYAMDPLPLQNKDQTKLYKFFDYLKEGKLTTTKCKQCGKVPWPPRTVCPECISDKLEWIELPKEGKIYAYTIQEAGVPIGFEAPLIFGVLDFGDVRFMARIVKADPKKIKVGDKVELEVIKVKGERVLPVFKPIDVS